MTLPVPEFHHLHYGPLLIEWVSLRLDVNEIKSQNDQLGDLINQYVLEFNARFSEKLLVLLELQKQYILLINKGKLNEEDAESVEATEKMIKQLESFREKLAHKNDESRIAVEKVKHKNKDQEGPGFARKLKYWYRLGCKYCHPDKVLPHQKKRAEKAFRDLTKAFQEKNLSMLILIVKSLKNGLLDKAENRDPVILLSKIMALRETMSDQIDLAGALQNHPDRSKAEDPNRVNVFYFESLRINQSILQYRDQIKLLKNKTAFN